MRPLQIERQQARLRRNPKGAKLNKRLSYSRNGLLETARRIVAVSEAPIITTIGVPAGGV